MEVIPVSSSGEGHLDKIPQSSGGMVYLGVSAARGKVRIQTVVDSGALYPSELG